MSPSHGDNQLFAVDHRPQQLTRSSFRGLAFTDRDQLLRPPKRRSADPVPAVPADARPGHPSPRALRRLLTHPTPLLLARIPTRRLSARWPDRQSV